MHHQYTRGTVVFRDGESGIRDVVDNLKGLWHFAKSRYICLTCLRRYFHPEITDEKMKIWRSMYGIDEGFGSLLLEEDA